MGMIRVEGASSGFLLELVGESGFFKDLLVVFGIVERDLAIVEYSRGRIVHHPAVHSDRLTCPSRSMGLQNACIDIERDWMTKSTYSQ
jgi:hypothetical protein